MTPNGVAVIWCFKWAFQDISHLLSLAWLGQIVRITRNQSPSLARIETLPVHSSVSSVSRARVRDDLTGPRPSGFSPVSRSRRWAKSLLRAKPPTG